ncbi:MAG: anaerobic sulfatase maturase [Clostridia bacterium]|nr:anaerobic sulfatase maturase [Clostridia bacterium]
MPPLNLLIKPVSHRCNLRCEYCFYRSDAAKRRVSNHGQMDTELLRVLVERGLEYADGYCNFIFQGGEPTLVGPDFYRALVTLQEQYNKKGIAVHNSIQTNGVLLDGEWASFLREHNFLCGLSLDGPEEVHDAYRVDSEGYGSFHRVMDAVRLLKEHGVEYNVLTVVNRAVAASFESVYGFLKKNGIRYQQYIQCIEPLGEEWGKHCYSLSPESYGVFLKTAFDLWYGDLISGNYHSIRTFENYVQIAAGYRPESCGMSGECSCNFVVESDGGVYPCDFYVLDEWYLGNVRDMSFEQLAFTPRAREFVELSKHIDGECARCRFFRLCRGGCRRCREPFLQGKPALNYYCSAYKAFFEYAEERIYMIANTLGKT